jgi:hypothetical protein
MKISKQPKLEKVVVWYSLINCGDGSVYPKWFISKEKAKKEDEDQEEGWGEPCYGSVETFIGSDIHKIAVDNEKEDDEENIEYYK